ncbi:MAG: hypothetical protein KGL39_33975 [Patescibacteria group bacterium]|nr:hypothetical protein [Patescibacteria group bacterium]
MWQNQTLPQFSNWSDMQAFAQAIAQNPDFISATGNVSQATISVDSTNVTLTWTKTLSPTGTAVMIIEGDA